MCKAKHINREKNGIEMAQSKAIYLREYSPSTGFIQDIL